MIFALTQMSATWQAFFFILAVVCFVLAAIRVTARIELVALGLAFFVLVFAYNALAAA